MLLGTAQKLKHRNALHLTINDEVLSSVECHKLLGIHVDYKFTCRDIYFDTQCKLIASRISHLQRLKYLSTPTCQKSFLFFLYFFHCWTTAVQYWDPPHKLTLNN